MPHSVIGYRLPLAIPYRWAKGVHHERAGLLVHVTLDDGEGWGEVAPPPHEAVDLAAWKRRIESDVDGLDPNDPHYLDLLDARRVHPRIRCGLATAWLSAQAFASGQSLAAKLATPASPAASVPVNGLVTDSEPEDAAATARAPTSRRSSGEDEMHRFDRHQQLGDGDRADRYPSRRCLPGAADPGLRARDCALLRTRRRPTASDRRRRHGRANHTRARRHPRPGPLTLRCSCRLLLSSHDHLVRTEHATFGPPWLYGCLMIVGAS